MATLLGSDQKHVEDTPSETVRLLRTEFNALLDFVLAIVNAAATDGNTFNSYHHLMGYLKQNFLHFLEQRDCQRT